MLTLIVESHFKNTDFYCHQGHCGNPETCVCVCAGVCACAFLFRWWLHLSPCPPNVTAPSGGSLAYLAADRPKVVAQSHRPCSLSDFNGTLHAIERHVLTPSQSSCTLFFVCVFLSSNFFSISLNTPFFTNQIFSIIFPLVCWPLLFILLLLQGKLALKYNLISPLSLPPPPPLLTSFLCAFSTPAFLPEHAKFPHRHNLSK